MKQENELTSPEKGVSSLECPRSLAWDSVQSIKDISDNIEANWIELKKGYLNRVCQF